MSFVFLYCFRLQGTCIPPCTGLLAASGPGAGPAAGAGAGPWGAGGAWPGAAGGVEAGSWVAGGGESGAAGAASRRRLWCALKLACVVGQWGNQLAPDALQDLFIQVRDCEIYKYVCLLTLTSTTAMQMLPLLAATSVEHKGGIVPPVPRSLAQPPFGSVPCACVLVSPLYINRA